MGEPKGREREGAAPEAVAGEEGQRLGQSGADGGGPTAGSVGSRGAARGGSSLAVAEEAPRRGVGIGGTRPEGEARRRGAMRVARSNEPGGGGDSRAGEASREAQGAGGAARTEASRRGAKVH